MATYTQKTNLATKGKLKSLCATTTDVSYSTELSMFSTLMTAANLYTGGMGLPGGMRSSIAYDIMRIPIRKDDSNVVFYILQDSACMRSSNCLTLAIRKPHHGSTIQNASPAWMVSNTVGTSTEESGWDLIRSTSLSMATSTEAEGYIAGPFESAKYAMNFGGTSTGTGSTVGTEGYESKFYIEKNQNYMEIMVGFTSVIGNTGGSWLLMTSIGIGAPNGSIVVVPIEIP
jgi:hypothetical protein